MAVTDPIADMFARIRNALAVRHDFVVFPFSKQKLAIVKILKDEGFVRHFEILTEDVKKKFIKVALKYVSGKPAILGLRRVSRPGKRRYVAKAEIPKVLNGFGVNFLTTSIGIITGSKARQNNVGGEMMGEVY